MGLRNVRVLLLAAAAGTTLSACVSFGISEPKDGAILSPSGTTTVTVNAVPSMSGLVVRLDGADVSNQINYVSDQTSQGNLSVPAGQHTITADANVPCWYCNPYHPSDRKNVCVATPGSLTTPSKTALAKGDSRTWTDTGGTTVGVGPDDGTLKTHWNLIYGALNGIGLIQSTQNPCLCMRSTDALQGTPIGLALCDRNDTTQQWQALKVGTTGNFYRIQNNGRGISDACLTEGPNNVLIQKPCNDTPDQLWSVRDNTSGMLGSPF